MDTDQYYMNLAMAVRKKANCRGRKVGAIVVLENRLISAGYNGTPEGFPNCLDGGCIRCLKKNEYGRQHYDICVCVHAEQNALLSAARFGFALAGATMYSTFRPCFSCTKGMPQVRIARVVYLHELGEPHEDPDVHKMYLELQGRFPRGLSRCEIADNEKAWALSKGPGT
jgi:dCMP deaminase